MSKMTNPFKTWTAVLCVVISAMWLSERSIAGIITFGIGANAFDMEFVAIGNPGNADDTTGSPNPAGSVAYAYNMGKYEVSEDMITKFNASQTLQITQDSRGANKPATSVSWNEAARFTNWLNTSTGGFAAYNFTTGGVNDNITPWTVADVLDYDASNPYRSLRTNYVLPSMDEWYKAAYYNPLTSTYSNFPNGLDTAPTAVASGTGAGTAVYNGQTGPADVNLAGGLSPYGIMGLGGNVFEWEETAFSLNNSSGSSDRGVRGGSWLVNDGLSLSLSSSSRDIIGPADESDFGIGFRVASLSSSAAAVPEPGSFAVLTLLGITGAAYRKRKRK